MPELPDVAVFKKELDSTSLHQEIERITVTDRRILEDSSTQAFGRRLKGAEFEGTVRRGKFLFARLATRGWLVLHFGMSGGLEYFDDDDPAPEYAKVIFHFSNGKSLAYTSRRMLGRVGFAGDLDEYVEKQDLGPDALENDLRPGEFADMMEGRRGMIKPLLMNQSFIAGVGNIWADEILFQARIHPKRKAHGIDRAKREEIFRAMERVLRVGAGKDGLLRNLPRSFLLAHRNEDRVCPRCGEELRSVKVSGRTAVYCPNCQKE